MKEKRGCGTSQYDTKKKFRYVIHDTRLKRTPSATDSRFTSNGSTVAWIEVPDGVRGIMLSHAKHVHDLVYFG